MEKIFMKNKLTHVDALKCINILVVASYFYPKIGGLENYAYLLAKKLHESGEYRVSILTSNYEGLHYKQEIVDGMMVHRLPILFKISNTPINPAWYWWAKRIIASEKPDIVHLHSPVPYLPDLAAAAAKDIPVVLTYHSGSMLKNKRIIDMFIAFYEHIFLRWLFKRADAVITISQEFAKRKFPQFTNKMYFIPTGVDLIRFKEMPLPMNTEVVTFVGRVELSSKWKGIDQLLLAMVIVLKRRPQSVLEIVGGGDALEYYKERAKEFGIFDRVIFSGPLLGDSLVRAYARSSAVVLPSISDAEAFSVVLVEAMASGRPIIGTNIGGTPQVIEHEKNGLLVPPKDPERLAEAIERILSNKELSLSMATYGALKAKNFSWDSQARKYSALFRAILRKY
ncbi:MAG: glycosyltransferase family 4 protein [bacterium]|nr:glycosyltransferase family 4 protein [bacterium]